MHQRDSNEPVLCLVSVLDVSNRCDGQTGRIRRVCVKCAAFNRDINKAGATKERPTITTDQVVRLQTEKSMSAKLNVLWASAAALDRRNLLTLESCNIFFALLQG